MKRNSFVLVGVTFLSCALWKYSTCLVYGCLAANRCKLHIACSDRCPTFARFHNLITQRVPSSAICVDQEGQGTSQRQSVSDTARLNNQANFTWLGPSILISKIHDSVLGARLAEVCLAFESADADGRCVSNRGGGWQSKDIAAFQDDALRMLSELLHEPLAHFVRERTNNGHFPKHLLQDDELEIHAVPDQLWANVNRPGGWNARHNHGPQTASMVASGVYYPMADHRSSSAGSARLKLFPSEGAVHVSPEAGLMVLFPPELDHEVERTDSSSDVRISFAFNLRARWLDSSLHRAAATGNAGRVSELLQLGEDPERADSMLGLQPLHIAAERGNFDVVSALLQAGVDASAVSPEGWTPLGLAVERGHMAVTKLLLAERQALIDAVMRGKLPERVMQREYAIHEVSAASASDKGHVAMLEILAETWPVNPSALPVAAAAGHSSVVRYLLAEGINHSTKGEGGRTPLREATGRGHVAVVELLLHAGVDVHETDESGSCAAHEAAAQGHLAVMQLLAKESQASGKIIDVVDLEGSRPLHWAARHGHLEIVKCLITARAAPNAGASGDTPLDWARAAGHTIIVQEILEHGTSTM